jgi:hypothetical protein
MDHEFTLERGKLALAQDTPPDMDDSKALHLVTQLLAEEYEPPFEYTPDADADMAFFLVQCLGGEIISADPPESEPGVIY